MGRNRQGEQGRDRERLEGSRGGVGSRWVHPLGPAGSRLCEVQLGVQGRTLQGREPQRGLYAWA